MERTGTPTTIVASSGFEGILEASARAFGLADLRYVLVAGGYNNITADEAIEQTDPVVDEVIRALTTDPHSPQAASNGNANVRHAERLFLGVDYASAWEEFNSEALAHEWGDGYPLFPPIPSRVAALMDRVDGEPDDVICTLPPGNGSATVKGVAINAAMAGCKPEELPLIMAALRAVAKEDSVYTRVALTSTSPCAPLIIVNGPIVEELGLNSGRGCIGPSGHNAVNIRVGRAVLLCLKNIGKWYPGALDPDTMGSTRKFGMCIAENEAESPWESFSTAHGFKDGESTASVLFTNGELDIAFQGDLGPEQLAKSIAACIGGGTNLSYISTFIAGDMPSEEGRLLLIAPPHAQPLSRGGFDREAFQQFLYEEVTDPVSKLIEPFRKLHADGKIKAEWEWLFELTDEEARHTTMRVVERPELFEIVVAGSIRAKDMVFPTLRVPVIEPVTASPRGG